MREMRCSSQFPEKNMFLMKKTNIILAMILFLLSLRHQMAGKDEKTEGN